VRSHSSRFTPRRQHAAHGKVRGRVGNFEIDGGSKCSQGDGLGRIGRTIGQDRLGAGEQGIACCNQIGRRIKQAVDANGDRRVGIDDCLRLGHVRSAVD
jgi:hypothetical protein